MPSVETATTREIAERYGEAWNENDLEAILAMQSDDFVFCLHSEGYEPAIGPEQARAQFAYFFDAFEGMHFEIGELRVDGELVTNEFRFSGTLVKPFPLVGEVVEPTGRQVSVDGVDVITIRDGLVRSKHTYMDTLAIRRQIDEDAADLVKRFAEAWTKCDPDAFTPLFHPDIHLIHPMERNTHGVEEAREFMARTMEQIPDLRYEVQGWSAGSGHVMIWGRLYGTLAGKPIEWPLVDKIKMEDGLIRERVAYFDPTAIAAQVIRRPGAWLPYLRAQVRRLRAG